MTFKQIAKKMRLSEIRVRQLHDRAMKKMIKTIKEDPQLQDVRDEFLNWMNNLNRKLPAP